MTTLTRFRSLYAMLAVLLMTGCASAPITLDSKYVFPQFEQVDKFTAFSLDSWQSVDNQSLIVQISPSRHYLLILTRPLYDLRFAEVIELSSTGPSIYAKFDCVKVRTRYCGPDPIGVSIHSIYKLRGKSQVTEAKLQIRQQVFPTD